MSGLTDLSGVGLAALVMILGYYLIVSLKSLLTHHYERQELLLQKILLSQIACAEELSAIRESFRNLSGSS